MIGPSLDTRYRRARIDPLGALLAGATDAGVRFRWAGADLQVDRLDRIPVADQILIARNLPAIAERLAEPGDDGTEVLAALGVDTVEMITTVERAQAVIAALPEHAGLDIETEADGAERPWLAITKKGIRAKTQPQPKDKSALNPRRAKPRLIQVFDPSSRTVFVIDLHHVPLQALSDLWQRRLWIHNAAFEFAVLGAAGVTLPATVDTLQLAGLLLGCAPGARRLESVCEQVLGVRVSKAQQQSDWSATRLSPAQVRYAAVDAAAAYLAGREMYGMMGEQLRRCFRLQNRVVPVVAKMRLAGAPFDADVHRRTIEKWEQELAEKRATFVELTGEEPPARHLVGAWVEAHLPPDEIAGMPRTKTGAISAKTELLKYLAHREEIRPLLRVLWAKKRLESFGHNLITLADPATGRLYPDYMPCGAKTGRLTSSNPNAQQLPRDARAAIVAPPNKLLVRADLDQIELRVLAEIAGEQAMRELFAEGADVHRRTASWISGVPEEEIEKGDPRRKAAKAVVFGVNYGAGARTVRASAWARFDIDMSLEEAERARAAVFRAYPNIARYQQRQAELGRTARVVHSAAGRPLRSAWEANAELKYTTCSNFPIQSSATDVLLRSMVLLDRALVGLDAQLILSVHDELVVEAAADIADEVMAGMVATMTQAFAEFFPSAPTLKLVDAKICKAWGDE